jgi:hypothetical protein
MNRLPNVRKKQVTEKGNLSACYLLIVFDMLFCENSVETALNEEKLLIE